MAPLPLERRPRSVSHMSHSVWSWDLRQADIEREEFLFACLPHQSFLKYCTLTAMEMMATKSTYARGAGMGAFGQY